MQVRHVEVVGLRVRSLSVPTHDPFVIATGRVDATRSALVEIEIRDRDSGARARGLGEGAALPPVTWEDQPDVVRVIEAAAPQVGTCTIGPSLEELDSLLDRAFPTSPVSRAAVEMALLDAAARLDSQPLHVWLGGRLPTPPVVSDITIPILELDRMAELAREWWERGFRSFKVKVGKDLAFDVAALERMHAAVPEAVFRPDANGGFSEDQALRYVGAAERMGAVVECFEQPCGRDDLDGMARVAREIGPPVIADESVRTLRDLEEVLRARAADGVNLKLAKSGGLGRAREIGLRAQQAGLVLMVGGMVETRLGMTAATHLAASLGGVGFADLDTAWLLRDDPFLGGYAAVGPRYTLPDAPGLGISLRG